MLPPPRRRVDSAVIIGGALVLLGLLALIAELIRPGFDLARYGWPAFILLPGLVMLVVGLTGAGVSGVAIPGAIVTTAGLVLAVQNTFGIWATWAYAWALIFVCAPGAGIMLQGWARSSRGEVQVGLRVFLVGMAIFVLLATFFEGILHISNFDFGLVGKILVPGFLILAGLWLVLRRLRPAAPRP